VVWGTEFPQQGPGGLGRSPDKPEITVDNQTEELDGKTAINV